MYISRASVLRPFFRGDRYFHGKLTALHFLYFSVFFFPCYPRRFNPRVAGDAAESGPVAMAAAFVSGHCRWSPVKLAVPRVAQRSDPGRAPTMSAIWTLIRRGLSLPPRPSISRGRPRSWSCGSLRDVRTGDPVAMDFAYHGGSESACSSSLNRMYSVYTVKSDDRVSWITEQTLAFTLTPARRGFSFAPQESSVVVKVREREPLIYVNFVVNDNVDRECETEVREGEELCHRRVSFGVS